MPDNELLIRIDERTKQTAEDIGEMKNHLKSLNGQVATNVTDIALLGSRVGSVEKRPDAAGAVKKTGGAVLGIFGVWEFVKAVFIK